MVSPGSHQLHYDLSPRQTLTRGVVGSVTVKRGFRGSRGKHILCTNPEGDQRSR